MDSDSFNPYKHCIIMAEDYNEAEEIFYGDNPELDILWIVETDDADIAMDNYWYNGGFI
jgi:hypothetical protein